MSQRLSSEHGGLSNRALRSLLAAVEDMLAVRLTLRVVEGDGVSRQGARLFRVQAAVSPHGQGANVLCRAGVCAPEAERLARAQDLEQELWLLKAPVTP